MKRVNFIHPETKENTIGILYNDSKLTDKRVKIVCLKSSKGYIEVPKDNINDSWND